MNIRSEPTLITGRFDESSQRDVLALAARLQKEHFETMSASEIEQAAAEAGLGPEFVREAIRQFQEPSARPVERPSARPAENVPTKADWIAAAVPIAVVGWAFLIRALFALDPVLGRTGRPITIVLASLAVLATLSAGFWAARNARSASNTDSKDSSWTPAWISKAALYGVCSLMVVWTVLSRSPDVVPYAMICTLALAPFLGGVQRTYRDGFWVAAACFAAATTAAAIHEHSVLGPQFYHTPGWLWMITLVVGGLTTGLLGLFGQWIASLIRPKAAPAADRSELLRQLFELQSALNAHQRSMSFLSVDVVGSTAMKSGVSELEVEYSFRQYQSWVSEVVAMFGGEIQLTAGDGAMAMFPDSESAVRAAKMLLDGVDNFNATRNRLPTPFRLRCGISEGRVALDAASPLGHIQSPVVDRAASLQKAANPGCVLVSQELVTTAIPILGSLRQADLPIGIPGYAWP